MTKEPLCLNNSQKKVDLDYNGLQSLPFKLTTVGEVS